MKQLKLKKRIIWLLTIKLQLIKNQLRPQRQGNCTSFDCHTEIKVFR